VKTKLAVLAALLCICGLTSGGQERVITGRDLLAKMNSQAKSDKDYVMGYVQAVYAVYMNRLNTSTLASEKEIEPVLSAAKKYLAESDAQKLNQPANVLLKEVFERSFPRKKT
jgi:acetyl-CoA carboxylase carboxyltransferase component